MNQASPLSAFAARRDDRVGSASALPFSRSAGGAALPEDPLVFSDRTLARARGMLFHLAEGLLTRLADAASADVGDEWFTPAVLGLATEFGESRTLGPYAHALAVEGLLSERLNDNAAIDLVPPSLLARLEPELADRYRALHARFAYSQRMMALDFSALPAEQRRVAISILRRQAAGAGEEADQAARRVEDELRETAEDGVRETVLAEVLAVLQTQGGSRTELMDLSASGLPLFLTAVADVRGNGDRLQALWLLTEGQTNALASLLLDGGLAPDAVEMTCALLHPHLPPPPVVLAGHGAG